MRSPGYGIFSLDELDDDRVYSRTSRVLSISPDWTEQTWKEPAARREPQPACTAHPDSLRALAEEIAAVREREEWLRRFANARPGLNP